MKNSTTTTTTSPPPSFPEHPIPDDVVVVVPNQTIEGSEEGGVEGETLKLEDLNGGDDRDGGDGDDDGDSLPVGSGGRVIGDGKLRSIGKRKSSSVVDVVNEEDQNKKARLTEVEDPFTGKSICPVCHKLYFRPSASSALTTDAPSKGGDGEKRVEIKRGAPPKRGLVFDLNKPKVEEGSSSAAAAAGTSEAREPGAAEQRVEEEGRKKVVRPFDLNEMPKDGEDE